MARLARLVLPSLPHHVLQRGVRSMALFQTEADRRLSLQLLARFLTQHHVEIWAWCLMTNHVHLLLVPRDALGLARAGGEAHRRYTRTVNFREGVRGHLFQERFHSFPIQQDAHLLAVARYIERNPVRAGLSPRAVDYPWSSARHHVLGAPDPLLHQSPLRELVADWARFLHQEETHLAVIRRHVRTGRPWGTTAWLEQLEHRLGQPVRPRHGGWPKGRPRKLAAATRALE